MKQLFIILLFTALLNHAFSQERDLGRITDSISNEGKRLYRSEFASWYGTDVFQEKCKNQLAIADGYLSYDTEEGINNIFFSKGPDPVVLATISFGGDFNPNNYKLDTNSRKFTETENALYAIRKSALEQANKDTLFKVYKNTSLNPIPIIYQGAKRVYFLTGPQINGLVIMGNDYLIEFDDKNEIILKKALHKSALFFKDDSAQKEITTIHTHLPQSGDFITATDICTTMLYEKIARWKFHVVMSKDYVSSWDCNKNQLIILTKKVWERIYKSEKEKNN
jgi:hypothetical protein